MEKNSIRPSDCLKFRCKLLESNEGHDNHRDFSGVYFPRHRSFYLNEVVATTVGGLRSAPTLRLIEVHPLDVYLKSSSPLLLASASAGSTTKSGSTSSDDYYFLEDFQLGNRLSIGPSANARDRVPRTYTITEVDNGLLQTKKQPDAPPFDQRSFQTKRMRDLPQDVKETLFKIRDAFIERCGGVTGAIKRLGKRFRICDDDGNRAISKAEMKKACDDVGLEIPPAEFQKAVTAMDKDGSGDIDFEEFMEVVRGPMNMKRKLVVHEAFRKLDYTRDGFIDQKEIAAKYNAKGHPKVIAGEMTEAEVLVQFSSIWDTQERNGIITLSEFMDYYSGVSASVDNDDHFVLIVQNAWKL